MGWYGAVQSVTSGVLERCRRGGRKGCCLVQNRDEYGDEDGDEAVEIEGLGLETERRLREGLERV